MSSEWEERPFQELLSEKLRNGLTKPKGVRGEGVRMVNMGELFRYDRIGTQEMERVPLSEEETRTSLLAAGDLLFARQSLVEAGTGRCSLVLPAPEARTFESHLIRARPDPSVAHPEFLYYWFRSPVGFARVRSIVTQTGAAGIRGSDLAQISIPTPRVPEQLRIAAVLGALDDKIEHNRLIAHRAEKMWRAIWDGVERDTRRVKLADLVELVVERARTWENARYIALDDMPARSINLSEYQPGTAVSSSVTHFKKGDILFGSMRPYFHKVGLAPFDGITRTTTFVLRPKDAHLRTFALYVLSSTDVVRYATDTAVGTTIPYAKWESLRAFDVAPPKAAAGDVVERASESLLWFLGALSDESRTLRSLRDALLPRLVSGKLRVPESYVPA